MRFCKFNNLLEEKSIIKNIDNYRKNKSAEINIIRLIIAKKSD